MRCSGASPCPPILHAFCRKLSKLQLNGSLPDSWGKAGTFSRLQQLLIDDNKLSGEGTVRPLLPITVAVGTKAGPYAPLFRAAAAVTLVYLA